MHPITRRNFLMEAGAAFAALSTPCVLHAGTGAAAEGTTAEVSTPLGRVRGLEKDGIRIFRGLPFGEDPYVPERRFLAPVKAKPWEGILDATKPGSIPLQPDRKTPAMIGDALAAMGIEVDRHRLLLDGAIRTLGEHHVRARLHADVVPAFTVKIVSEEKHIVEEEAPVEAPAAEAEAPAEA